MTFRVSVFLVTAAAVLACARPAQAQFEIAGRQFHNASAFPLDGRHQSVPCESCHRQGVVKATPAKCFDCHWVRRQDDKYRLQLGSQCEQCHRTTAWTSVQWNHGTATGMALSASHRVLPCGSCHKGSDFRTSIGAGATCYTCHQQDYEATKNPNHVAAGFPTTCDACHRPMDTSWRGAGASHNSVFPLQGRHATAACAACHVNNIYQGTSRDCVGCHRDAYDRTTSPNHRAAGFSTTCESCHRAADSSWSLGTFNHRFPITSGPHRQSCATCHTTAGNFQAFTCLVCHEHDRVKMDDKHKSQAGYRYDSLACYSCHPNGRH